MVNNLYKDICKNGTYYYPATSHYTLMGLDCNGVVCDRCKRDSLEVCIGRGDSDLCLKCVQDIANMIKEIQCPVAHMTRME